jgi:hypothetical protein
MRGEAMRRIEIEQARKDRGEKINPTTLVELEEEIENLNNLKSVKTRRVKYQFKMGNDGYKGRILRGASPLDPPGYNDIMHYCTQSWHKRNLMIYLKTVRDSL